MKTRSLRRLMHLVLAASATACGGAIASQDLFTEADPTGDPGDPGKGDPDDPPPAPRRRRDAGVDARDASRDATSDAKQDVISPPVCESGQLTPSPIDDVCCDDPNNCPNWSGGDQGACKLDCRKVCAIGAPGVPPGFAEWCHWDTSGVSDSIQFTCGACGVGRIPEGTVSCGRGVGIGERLAMQAYYEAASVVAFARLAGVLEEEKAPRALVRRVRKAAKDEERHARMFGVLARRFGATVPAVCIDNEETSLFSLALENAREGCVRETFGALVALHQAAHAEDPALRAAFAAIADDEVEHAALSWDLARFFEARLSSRERTALVEAHDEAREVLRTAATAQFDATDRRLGMPAPAAARAMFDDLFARLAA